MMLARSFSFFKPANTILVPCDGGHDQPTWRRQPPSNGSATRPPTRTRTTRCHNPLPRTGMYFFGFTRYASSTSGVQTMPLPLLAAE